MERKIMERLLRWKESARRKPLILHGARQVGKTYILKEFGRQYFRNTVYFHMERNSRVRGYFEDEIEIRKLISYLEAEASEKIDAAETLIIFDEIQVCPAAVTALKYFCEEAPEYHICAAGSLLGVAIHWENFSYPVGKVQTMRLYPMDFEEYLLASRQELLRDEIVRCFREQVPMPESLHQKALQCYREYLVVGGMPEAVQCYLNHGSFMDVEEVQGEILDAYIADMAKYASGSDTVKIRGCYDSIPAQLAKDNRKFQYKIVQKGGTAALFGTALEWLNQSGVILKCERIERGDSPLEAQKDLSSFKIYMSDIGLLVYKSGIPKAEILSQSVNDFMGALTENYVAVQLMCRERHLFYWATADSQAELDFVIQDEQGIAGIEVKSSIHTRSRSLYMFQKKYDPQRCIRLSTKNMGWENGIISLPLYALFVL